jgi:hypothetical protein
MQMANDIERIKSFNSTAYTADYPCNGCKYADHCSGKRDWVTGAEKTAGDTCERYDVHESVIRIVKATHVQVPHRVRGALTLWGDQGKGEVVQ